MRPEFIILGVLLGLLIYTLFSNFGIEVVSEPVSEEEADRLVKSRANMLTNICDTVGDAWDLPRESINTNMELIPHENTLVTMIYKNNLLRIYVYWDSKQVQVNLTQKLDNGKSKVYKKSFGLYRKNMLEDVYSYLEKFKPTKEENAAEDERVAAVKEAVVDKLSEYIEQIVDEKVHERLDELIKQLEEDEKDHEQWSFFLVQMNKICYTIYIRKGRTIKC